MGSQLGRFRAATALSATAALAVFGIALPPSALADELPETPAATAATIAEQEPSGESLLEDAVDSVLPGLGQDAREAPAAEPESETGRDEAAQEPEAIEAPEEIETEPRLPGAREPSAPEEPAPATVEAQPRAAGYRVYGFVWEDMWGDGVFDYGVDYGIYGAEVELLDENGGVVDTVVTEGRAPYSFEDIEPGTYRVRFAPVDDLNFVPAPPQASEDESASDIDSEGYSETFTLSAEQATVQVDAAFAGDVLVEKVPNLLLGSYYDADRDGVSDEMETGAPGVEIEILGADGNVHSTTTTDEGGVSMGELEIGEYRLRVIPPEGYVVTGAERLDFSLDLEDVSLRPLEIDANGLTPYFAIVGAAPFGIIIGIAEEVAVAAPAPAPVKPAVEPAALNPQPVAAPGEPQPTARLAETGSSASAWAPWAGLVIAAGALLLRLGRRRAA